MQYISQDMCSGNIEFEVINNRILAIALQKIVDGNC